MARIARVVAPGLPHHIVQRGNRRQKVFFTEQDRIEYLRILREQSLRFNVSIWAYCLMENHVHLVVVPESKEGLSRMFGETHRRYTCRVHLREGWSGYLWQGRFMSYVLNEKHLYAAVRYVEQNPLKAQMVAKAEDYPWSSAKAHVYRTADAVLSKFFLLDEIKNWSEYLKLWDEAEGLELERHLKTGRPMGDDSFIACLENSLGRMLRKKKPGPSGVSLVN